MSDFMAALPHTTNATKPFWDACNRRELLIPKCQACENLFYYPRIACPHCGSMRLGWHPSTGHGTIFTLSHVQMSFFGPAWSDEIPYTVVLIDLDEEVRILSRLVGEGREKATVGARVILDFQTVGDQYLPFFRLANDAAQISAARGSSES